MEPYLQILKRYKPNDLLFQRALHKYQIAWQDFQYAEPNFIDASIERLNEAEEHIGTIMPDAIKFLPSFDVYARDL
jgi:hypothetical protein